MEYIDGQLLALKNEKYILEKLNFMYVQKLNFIDSERLESIRVPLVQCTAYLIYVTSFFICF